MGLSLAVIRVVVSAFTVGDIIVHLLSFPSSSSSSLSPTTESKLKEAIEQGQPVQHLKVRLQHAVCFAP